MAEAAEKRREFAELQYRNLLMAGAFQKSGFGVVNYYFISQPQMSAATAG